jgi:hypothetical protein
MAYILQRLRMKRFPHDTEVFNMMLAIDFRVVPRGQLRAELRVVRGAWVYRQRQRLRLRWGGRFGGLHRGHRFQPLCFGERRGVEETGEGDLLRITWASFCPFL